MRTSAVLFLLALGPVSSFLGQSVTSSTSRPASDYSAESVVVDKMATVYRFAADGTGTRENTAVIRIQSEAAARQYGVINFSFAANSERVEIDYVRVRKPDGSLVETPASDAQEMPQEVTREAPFYSDLKEKQVPVRNLRIGDTLEYKTRVVDTIAEVPGQFWGQESFGLWAVILNQTVELHLPKSKIVKVWSPTAQPTKSEAGDEVVYRWTTSQLTPIAPKDSPLKHREFDPKGELPTIAWTTFKSWDEVGAWYRSLEADRILPDPTIKSKVAELTAGKTTDEEKAHVLYSYVATQIRYIGVAFGIGRYQPHPAAEVMRNQYGDCKDKHTLLAAMLTAAGLHPSASMIGAGIRLNEKVPSPSAFNHMITMVPMNGKQVWLDTTAEVAPWGMLVSPTRDKETLVVPDAGVAKLEKTPQTMPFTPMSRFAAKGSLAKDGTMKAQMEYTARGDDELVLRTLLRQVPPGQWDDLSQKLSQGMGFSGTTSHTEAGRPDKTDELARIAYDYEKEKFGGDWDNHRIVPLFPAIFLGPVDDKYPPKKFPIPLGEPHTETSLSVIKLPAGWGASLPEAVHQKTPYITFDKTYKVEGDTLTVERKMEILQREIPATEWKTYKNWYDKAIGEGENYISLVSTESKMGGNEESASGTDMQELTKQFYEQIQRGEKNAATQTADKIRQIDPKSVWTYRTQIVVKLGQEKAQEAVPLARELLKQTSSTEHDRMLALNIFRLTDHNEDALPLLEKMTVEKPDDLPLKQQLGIAQIRTGQMEKGKITLTTVLDKTLDPLLLNDAAYELADADMALPQAEVAAQKAVDTYTEEAAGWSPGSDSKDQRIKQNLLIASWDTLGWTLFKEGKTAEAEEWLRAAWLNTPGGEGALHMGAIEEIRGNSTKAMAYYRMGLSAANAYVPKEAKSMKITLPPNPLADKLNAHIDALKKRGVAVPTQDPSVALTHEKTLTIGPHPGKNQMESYTIALAGDAVAEAIPDDGASITEAGKALVMKANATGWNPSGSKAKILHKAMLNCHSGTCDLVIQLK